MKTLLKKLYFILLNIVTISNISAQSQETICMNLLRPYDYTMYGALNNISSDSNNPYTISSVNMNSLGIKSPTITNQCNSNTGGCSFQDYLNAGGSGSFPAPARPTNTFQLLPFGPTVMQPLNPTGATLPTGTTTSTDNPQSLTSTGVIELIQAQANSNSANPTKFVFQMYQSEETTYLRISKQTWGPTLAGGQGYLISSAVLLDVFKLLKESFPPFIEWCQNDPNKILGFDALCQNGQCVNLLAKDATLIALKTLWNVNVRIDANDNIKIDSVTLYNPHLSMTSPNGQHANNITITDSIATNPLCANNICSSELNNYVIYID